MNPEYLRALQAEILARQDCAALRVTPDMGKVADAAQRDQQIAEILNAAGWGASSQPIPCHLAKKLLIKRGKWRAIVQASQNNDHPAVEAAYAAVSLAEDARMDADFKDAAAGPLLAGLVAAGLLSADDVSSLQAMCTVASNVTADHVSRALRGPWGDE